MSVRLNFHELRSQRYHTLQAEAFRFLGDQWLQAVVGGHFETIGRENDEEWKIVTAGAGRPVRLASFESVEEGQPLLLRGMREDGSYGEQRSSDVYVSLARDFIDVRLTLADERVFWLEQGRERFVSDRGLRYDSLVIGDLAYFHGHPALEPTELGARSRLSPLAC